jgi:hypothetical protein
MGYGATDLSLLNVVITGLDPVIHAFWRVDPLDGEAWMAGSSPAMTGGGEEASWLMKPKLRSH